MCLDTLRAMGRHPRSIEILVAEIAPALGKNRAFDAFVAKLKDGLTNPQDVEIRARDLTQGIALAMQGALLLCHAPEPVSAAFCATRLTPGHWGSAFGTLPAATNFTALLERAWPNS
jgi:putative acyl-CoA dehydrogenase